MLYRAFFVGGGGGGGGESERGCKLDFRHGRSAKALTRVEKLIKHVKATAIPGLGFRV